MIRLQTKRKEEDYEREFSRCSFQPAFLPSTLQCIVVITLLLSIITLSTQLSSQIQSWWISALEGGIPGAAAMVVQVFALLWLRTTMNYQYRYGGSMKQALLHLYREGGIPRLYAGLLPALIQGPLARFGDTAANNGVQTALRSLEATKDWSTATVSLVCSLVAGLFRILLVPLEVVKTTLQVEGRSGFVSLLRRVSQRGFCCLFEGVLATFAAHFCGHYPWFATRNFLTGIWTKSDDAPFNVFRNAVIGLLASIVADTFSNPARVIKTYKQTSMEQISYLSAIQQVLAQGGFQGFFTRGLGTKVFCNAIQSMFFNITWELFQEKYKLLRSA